MVSQKKPRRKPYFIFRFRTFSDKPNRELRQRRANWTCFKLQKPSYAARRVLNVSKRERRDDFPPAKPQRKKKWSQNPQISPNLFTKPNSKLLVKLTSHSDSSCVGEHMNGDDSIAGLRHLDQSPRQQLFTPLIQLHSHNHHRPAITAAAAAWFFWFSYQFHPAVFSSRRKISQRRRFKILKRRRLCTLLLPLHVSAHSLHFIGNANRGGCPSTCCMGNIPVFRHTLPFNSGRPLESDYIRWWSVCRWIRKADD